MFQRRHVWLLSVITIAAAYLSYRELTARGGFVSGMMIGVLLCSLFVVWFEMFKAKKAQG
jgi:lipopolysaccharide export LptBFGC system permease protein LptF